jgi:Ser/Thr protein kinase RdoA (MazF antagonist)
MSDELVASVGRLLRSYHDATVDFIGQGIVGWQLPTVDPVEVICHNDVAPYNCVTRAGVAVAFIDFDTAAPGPRSWDLAYALYRFGMLSEDAGNVGDQGRRMQLLLDGYDASPAVRAAAIRSISARLGALVDWMESQAARGHPAYRGHIADGHADAYRRDIAHAIRRESTWLRGQ